MSSTTLTVMLAAAALGTFLMRASFLTLVPAEKLPRWAKRGLRYVPPAVLASLAVPAFAPGTWPPEGAAALVRPAAALVALVVAWRVGNVFVTIGAGMATLWILTALV
jgi:branched-subunit amino acid transport protein